MPSFVLAPGIFFCTLVMVIWRPRQVNEAIPALAGALAALLTGIVTWRDFWLVGHMVWNATFALVAIMIISSILDQVGFFRWTALVLARKVGGSGYRLFLLVIVLGSLITIFFNNDGTVLVLTPIVYGMMTEMGWPQKKVLPFVMACGFIADTASIPLVVSNLVNILTADYLRLSFVDYAARMLVPGLAGILASAVALFLFYRRDIPPHFDQDRIQDPRGAVRDWWLCRFALGILGAVVIGYFIGSWYRVPVSLVAGTGSMILILASIYRGSIDTRSILRCAPWPIVAFAMGMYLVVYGLGNQGLTVVLGNLLQRLVEDSPFRGSLMSGGMFSLVAAVMNNLPSAMTSSLTVAAAPLSPEVKEAAALASIVGNGIGPKMTPIGSLATLMWMHILRQKGVTVSWGYYMRVGLTITPPVLLVTLLSLHWWLTLLR